MVIESRDGFQPVCADTRLSVEQEGDGVDIRGDGLHSMELCDSLDAAVHVYRAGHPLPDKIGPGRPRRFARAVTLDLWHPDGRILHTYTDALQLVDDLAGRSLADGTLLYLPGWSAPYDRGYPCFRPAAELGGDDGFSRLVADAREMGTTVMPHTNFWAYDASTDLLTDWREFQVRDPSGKPMEWPGVLRAGFTNPLAYMRVDDDRWIDAFFSHIDPLTERFGLEALYLDQIGHAVDDGIVQGSLQMLERIHTEHPDLTLGAELLADFLIPYIDLMQAWGMPWSGGMVDFTGDFSPIATRLYEGSLVFMSHIGQPCALPAPVCWGNYPFIAEKGQEMAFQISQKHNRNVGCIPHVRIAYRSHGLDSQSLSVLKRSDA